MLGMLEFYRGAILRVRMMEVVAEEVFKMFLQDFQESTCDRDLESLFSKIVGTDLQF